MNLEYRIGIRFLLSRRKSRTLSINTIISICGVTVGVAALIATLAIMTGFKEDVRDKILGANSHIIINSLNPDGIAGYDKKIEQIKKLPGIAGIAPFVYQQVLISYNRKSAGVLIRGVNPEDVRKTTNIGENMLVGDLNSLSEKNTSERHILIGKEIALRLGVFIGDQVNILSPEGEITPLGLIPKMRKFTVSGIFETGMYEYDSSLVYIPLSEGQRFFNMDGRVSGIEVKMKDIYQAEPTALKIEKLLGSDFIARDWQKLNKNLFSALALEKAMMFIILVLIILVASFNILGTLSMMIIERAKEIGILKTIGITNSAIMRIFMIEGGLIGLSGTLLGMPLGISICVLLEKFYKLPGDVYYIDHLPVKLQMFDVTLVLLAAIGISLLATFYPAMQAAKANPAEILRYE